MKEAFETRDYWKKKSLIRIDQANAIIAEMAADGYVLTLRQLFYQFVSRGWIANRQSEYDALGKLIDSARKCGLVDWKAIEDRTRGLRSINTFDSVEDFIQSTSHWYAEDIWRDQEWYAEFWVEKDALVGVVERPAAELRVPYFACRGYPSSSELYRAGKRFRRKMMEKKRPIIFYIGDHDPSGIHMPQSNLDWVARYARDNDIALNRVALNMDQIEEYNPPPNPAKETDSRYGAYVEMYGAECWELDALNPRVIDQILRNAVDTVLDRDKFDKNVETEKQHRSQYEAIGDNYADVSRYLKYRNHYGDRIDMLLKGIESRVISEIG